jgi:DNA repair exonuclease SbcCD ATPase subunit
MAIKGLDSFLDVVEVLGNPKKYQDKINEIKAATKQYTEVVEAVVALAGVNDYTENIKKRDEETKILLTEAKEKALSITAEAKAKAAEKLKKIDEMEDSLRKQADTLLAETTRLEALKAELDKQQAEIKEEKAYLAARTSDLAVANQALAEKQAKLKAALA